MWFSASLLMKGNSSERSDEDIFWEDSIVLIQADDEEDAIVQADALGKAAENQYVAATGESLSWTFERIERVFEIGEVLASGMELFSRHLSTTALGCLFRRLATHR